MRYVWFWTFWHWTRESYREGYLLRDPLQGIAGHWDEWYRHGASESDLRSIADAGSSRRTQRQFLAWVFRHWAAAAGWPRDRVIPRYVLGQLAHLPPFDHWTELKEYRERYGMGGVSAIVLGAESRGEAGDVRRVEAWTLPVSNGPLLVTEGFQADLNDLEVARRAAFSLMSGSGLLRGLAAWSFAGRRPFRRWISASLAAGWLAVAALMLGLRFGPEPGDSVPALAAVMVGLWTVLTGVALTTIAIEARRAWQVGRAWKAHLQQSQLRFRMEGGLTVQGASAGLSFALNAVLAAQRRCQVAWKRSWLWSSLCRSLRASRSGWAATGRVSAGGRVFPVVLEPKLRACLQQMEVTQVMMPRQAEAFPRARIRPQLAPSVSPGSRESWTPSDGWRVGFAAETNRVWHHPFRHVSEVFLAVGGLASRGQLGVSTVALVCSVFLLLGAGDLRGLLRPPPIPEVAPPQATLPLHLAVTFHTRHSEDFRVVLESSHWANRRAELKEGPVSGSAHAQVVMSRVVGSSASDGDEGTLWLERRRHFLGREFLPGERVGRFTLAYLNHLAGE